MNRAPRWIENARTFGSAALSLARAVGLLGVASLVSACGPTTPATGGIVEFTASGESLALGGYPFPPGADSAGFFVDGWALRFDALLVTLDHVALYESPDTSSTDQSLVGARVAHLDGPFAVDLHLGGPLLGKGGGAERAVLLGTLDRQTDKGGAPFDDGARYAFGYDLVPASASATRVSLDASHEADYAAMVAAGQTVLYVGTATWKGDSTGPCASNDAAYDFSTLPRTVRFRLGFASPTTYRNCQNPDNDPARGLGDEEHQRGVYVRQNQPTFAQLTVHTDHPFWESLIHDSPAHFDPIAARARKVNGEWLVTEAELRGVNYTEFTDGNGAPLPFRWCAAAATGYSPPNSARAMSFDSLGIPYDPEPSADPSHAFRDYLDFMTYNQSTQGHLDSDGLCFVLRHYPSPR